MNFPGFYVIENDAHGFVGDASIGNSKDSEAVPIVKIALDDVNPFYITQEPHGTFIIRSLAEKFTRKVADYRKREVAVIHDNEIVAYPDDNKHLHRWKLVRDVAHPTHFHILDADTMAYWRLSARHPGTKVHLYYPIPGTTIPPGIAWKLTPELQDGKYYIKNILYGDINIGTKNDGGISLVVAASSPAVWRIKVSGMQPPEYGARFPDGATWNIFFIKSKSKSPANTSFPVRRVDNTIIISEDTSEDVEVSAQCNWHPIWSADEGAWRIKDIGIGRSGVEWSLAHDYEDGKSEQVHVLCGYEQNGCSLWELIRIGD
ncbi:hypothetical protein Hypma_002921 [Hypsizygus marmoreus]|uniref:Uncharacterized protein n=1 Tax=Hypsizygus marmoreus TaxID=39966 RepID=A0A369J768_HYPMA|nr:hypothetical protein Hypma_002921 [Hypsizygus marmoreus]